MPPKKDGTRDANWSSSEIRSLIKIYEDKFSALERMSVKKPIYEEMANKLQEQGFQTRTGSQISRKIQWLRKTYKSSKPGLTGDTPPKWEFYVDMHKILHERPSLNTAVAETSAVGLDFDLHEPDATFADESLSSPISEISDVGNEENDTPRPKRPKNYTSSDLVSVAKESLEFMKLEARKDEEERNVLREINNGILLQLQRMAQSSERLADAVEKRNR